MLQSIRAMWSLGQFVAQHPLNRDRPLDALARAVRWQVGSRLVPAPVIIDWVGKSRLIVGRGMTGATGNLYAGLHEFADMAFLLHYLRSQDVFLDVGANIGSYTVLAAAACGARVVSFEPVPETFERLMDNIRLNGSEEVVKALNVAVGDETKFISFTANGDTTNHALAPDETTDAVVEVPVVRLDDVAPKEAIALMKIDVEGFESLVLKGGPETFARTDAVLLELNESGTRYGFRDADIAAEMAAWGFSPFGYQPETRTLVEVDPLGVRGGNVLYLRDAEAARARVKSGPTHQLGDRRI